MITYVVTQMGHYLPIVCRGICSNLEEDVVRDYLDPIMEDLAEAYLRILEKQKGKRKEFFGLRDFYRYVCYHLVQLLQLIYHRRTMSSTVRMRCILHITGQFSIAHLPNQAALVTSSCLTRQQCIASSATGLHNLLPCYATGCWLHNGAS